MKKIGGKNMEISFLNNIKKYNSRNNKENITNVMNEAFRESEEFKNNVNEKLNSENRVLVILMCLKDNMKIQKYQQKQRTL